MAPEHAVERRQTERRSGIENRRNLFSAFAGSKRKVWERRSYLATTDRRQAMQLTAA